MIELHVVGYTPDRRYLVLEGAGGDRYRLAVDDGLVAALGEVMQGPSEAEGGTGPGDPGGDDPGRGGLIRVFVDADEADDPEALQRLDHHELRAILGAVDDDIGSGSGVRLLDEGELEALLADRLEQPSGGGARPASGATASASSPAGGERDDREHDRAGGSSMGQPDSRWHRLGEVAGWGGAQRPDRTDPPPAWSRAPGTDADTDPDTEQPASDAGDADTDPDTEQSASDAGPVDDPAHESGDDPHERDQRTPDREEEPDPGERTGGPEETSAQDPKPAAGSAQRRSTPSSRLTPAEIQARLRAGRSVRAVAREAETDEAWIERWLPPIMEERARIMRDAHARRLVRQRLGRSRHTLAEAVQRNLDSRKVTVEKVRWETARRKDGRWRVTVRWQQRGRARSASWLLDIEADELVPASSQARDLGWTGRRKRRG